MSEIASAEIRGNWGLQNGQLLRIISARLFIETPD